jgi:peptidoglycan/LPS O-acetylase OafA/YrhL
MKAQTPKSQAAKAQTKSAAPAASHLTHPKYRADIDGLRAIAVLSVVGFHAFPKLVHGGFIGVDIFFVVSGFLISTILYGSLERNSFDFIEFYSRRIRRIFPALLVVLIAALTVGWIVLLSDEYKQFGKHLAGGAGFVSNLVLWKESGYFDNAAETKPLLHLWSLGIEEQFYIIWPFLLWAAWKSKLNLLAITVTIAVVSFAVNMNKAYSDSVADFYSPQTRFWELLIGAALAYAALYRKAWFADSESRLPNVQSALGAILIAASLLFITRDKAFPGWWAALPTLGAALLISAGPRAWLNRTILSNRVLVWLGLVSFPIYLWHWPLLAFPRIVNGETPSDAVRLSAVLLSIVLASMTYLLVEKPLRFNSYSKRTTVALLAVMIVVGFAGYLIYGLNGLTFRTATTPQVNNEGAIDHATFHQYGQTHFYPCTPLSIRSQATFWEGSLRCLQSQRDKPIDIAIIGDSHAEDLFLGLAESLPDLNVVYYLKTTLPVISDRDFSPVFQYILSDSNIKTVIISAFWYGKQGMVPKGSNLERELSDTVEKLGAAHKEVYITDDVPFFSFDPAQCKYSRRFSSKTNCVQDGAIFDHQLKNYYPILKSIAQTHTNVRLVDTAKYFCSSDVCTMAMSGNIMYRDNNHLNLNGTRYVARKFLDDYPHLATPSGFNP